MLRETILRFKGRRSASAAGCCARFSIYLPGALSLCRLGRPARPTVNFIYLDVDMSLSGPHAPTGRGVGLGGQEHVYTNMSGLCRDRAPVPSRRPSLSVPERSLRASLQANPKMLAISAQRLRIAVRGCGDCGIEVSSRTTRCKTRFLSVKDLVKEIPSMHCGLLPEASKRG